MQVRLLGPVDVVVDGQPRPIGGRRRTGLLAVLALAAGEVVSAEWLSEAVWGGSSPRDNTLHSHISALPRVLGKDAIVAHPPGYVLNLGAEGTDVQAAERLLRQGAAAAEPAQAVADLRAALARWRGEPLTGVADLPGLSGQAGRLEGLRAQIRRALVEARLAAGEHHQLTGELEQMVTCCEQALEALRETGGGGWEANILDSLGYIHHQLGNRDSSIACYQRALGIFRDLGDRLEEAEALSHLGDVLYGSGDTEAARRAWLEALNIYDEIDHPDADEIRAKLQPPGAQPESSSA